MKLTDQQKAILSVNSNMVINAVAGSGKTTTLIEYARTRPSASRILYLAFNKTVKLEADQKFRAAGLRNVRVETAHALAFDQVVKTGRYQVTTGYKSYEWAEMLGIQTGDLQADYQIANHVSKFISYFCNSTARKVQDLDYAATIGEQKAFQFVKHFYDPIEQHTRQALAKMDKGEIAVTHDFYLKKFQLAQPRLPFDYILFDEGQDASGAMLQVFLEQPATKIIVGDRHQQIYGWRFAVNSLQQVDFPLYPLTHSFRFDEEIALIANKVLAWKKHLDEAPGLKVIGAGESTGGVNSRATLARTNLSLLLNAISLWQNGDIKKVFFEGNISSYTFADEGASLYDVLNLYNEKPEKIRDKLLGTMKSMKDLEEYIDKTEDNSLRMIADVVRQWGNELPSLIRELKENHTAQKEEADRIFSTVHRCKGLEYDEVTLLPDFINEEKLQKQIAELSNPQLSDANKARLAEEVNIAYVAATRARNQLIIPEEFNPLRSLQIRNTQPPAQPSRKQYLSGDSDWLSHSRSRLRSSARPSDKGSDSGNHGLPWSREEEEQLVEWYQQGASLPEMARHLKRGIGAIRFKLKGLGLEDN